MPPCPPWNAQLAFVSRWGAWDEMLRPRKTIDPVAAVAKLDDLASVLRREADRAEVDPYDEALLGAVFGLIETSKAETVAFGKIETQFGKLARRR